MNYVTVQCTKTMKFWFCVFFDEQNHNLIVKDMNGARDLFFEENLNKIYSFKSLEEFRQHEYQIEDFLQNLIKEN
jgi:hypothetical protein